jgi:hypothetical protein
MANWKRIPSMATLTLLPSAAVLTPNTGWTQDYRAALAVWHQQADQGNAEAQSSLGNPVFYLGERHQPAGPLHSLGSNGLATNFKGANLYLLSGSFVTGNTRGSERQLKSARRNQADDKTTIDPKSL